VLICAFPNSKCSYNYFNSVYHSLQMYEPADGRQFDESELKFIREIRATYNRRSALKPIKSVSTARRYVREGRNLIRQVKENDFQSVVDWEVVCASNEVPMSSIGIFDELMQEKTRRETAHVSSFSADQHFVDHGPSSELQNVPSSDSHHFPASAAIDVDDHDAASRNGVNLSVPVSAGVLAADQASGCQADNSDRRANPCQNGVPSSPSSGTRETAAESLADGFDDSFFLTGDLRCSTPLPPERDVAFLESFPETKTSDNYDDEFRLWASYYGKSQNSIDKLLKVLHRNGKASSLPKCVKTLFSSRVVTTLKKKARIIRIYRKVGSKGQVRDGIPVPNREEEVGTYLHVGLVDGVMLSSAGKLESIFRIVLGIVINQYN
jgi:hypothetical protein